MQISSVRPARHVQGQRPAPPGFRPDIEGLRAVTLLAILGFHAELPGAGGGFVGPDIFFIISGFVITGQLWKDIEKTGTVGLRRFYAGRARRLLPVSALIGIMTLIGSAILLPPMQLRNVIGDGIACALYVGNYRFAWQGVDYFAANRAPSPFQHYWTLGVEEQFYLIWPVLLIGTAWITMHMRRGRGAPAQPSKIPYVVLLAFTAGASFGYSLWATGNMPSLAYFSLPTRAWDLAAGCLLALSVQHWRRLPKLLAVPLGWTGLALIVLACNQFRPTTPYPGTAALVPLLGTLLVLGAGCAAPSEGCGRVLGWGPLRAVGRLSYSWYLWHWPILLFVPLMLDRPVGLADRLAAVAISGGLAMLTLHAVENPLRYAPRLRRSVKASLAVGAFATALATCVGVAMLLLIPAPVGRSAAAQALDITAAPPLVNASADEYSRAIQRAFAQVQTAVAESADLPDVPSNLEPSLEDAAGEPQRLFFGGCLRNFLEVGVPECALADRSSSTTVALIGDSNGAMWTPALQEVATQRHWRLEIMAKGNCPVMDLPTIISGRRYTECEQWRNDVTARLQAEHPQLIVLSVWRRYGAADVPARFTAYDSLWLDRLTTLVRQLRATGARVLVLGPIPDPQSPVPECLSMHLDDATACAPEKAVAVNRTGIAAETAAVEAAGGQYADVTDLFCAGDRCPVIVGNTMVYFDRNHISLEYSQLLAPAIGLLADRAFGSR